MTKDSNKLSDCIALSKGLRAFSIDSVQSAKSGHPGMPLGMADVASVLFANHIAFDPKHPSWINRDRFVLSAGHGSALLYSILHLLGVAQVSLSELMNFRQYGSITAGHPEVGLCPGVDTTTGPLGQGLANALGMAFAERILNAKFGNDIINHFTFVIAGDGCLMEGISQEAISLAGHHQLEKLILLYDSNRISIDGSTELTFSEDTAMRFRACNWHVQTINGHDHHQIDKAITKAKETNYPSLIICETVIGFGSPNKSDTADAHGAPLGEQEISLTKKRLGLIDKPFHIDKKIISLWRSVGKRGSEKYEKWRKNLNHEDKKSLLEKFDINNTIPDNLDELLNDFKNNLCEEELSIATRASSRKVLAKLLKTIPAMIGGSADLTESNQTRPDGLLTFSKSQPLGRYIHYGVREHAMVATMSGMALHGGVVPYGGSFLTFSDYARPAIRLAALMKLQIIFVGSHDSIGLGEDGPTHQPIEHLASLRAIPNLMVFRPCDAIETLESWTTALKLKNSPSVIALSRQATKNIRKNHTKDNLAAQGAYIIQSFGKNNQNNISIVASGTEVALACEVGKTLLKNNISSKIVSVPCLDIFKQQTLTYQKQIISGICIVIEAGIIQGWEGFLGDNGLFFGVDNFGVSAPLTQSYKHFKLTVDDISQDILNAIN